MGFHQIWGAKQEYLRNIRFGFARLKSDHLVLFVSGFTDGVAFFTGKILRSTPFVCFLTNKTKEQNNPVLPLSGTFGNAKRKTNLSFLLLVQNGGYRSDGGCGGGECGGCVCNRRRHNRRFSSWKTLKDVQLFVE